MTAVLLILALWTSSAATLVFDSGYSNESPSEESNDCCPLVWKQLDEGMIPIHAVVAGHEDGQDSFYARAKLIVDADVDVATSYGIKYEGRRYRALYASNKLASTNVYEYWMQIDNCMQGCWKHADGWVGLKSKQWQTTRCHEAETMWILTNPHGCELTWWRRNISSALPPETRRYFYPTSADEAFSVRYHFARNQGAGGNAGAGFVHLSNADPAASYREVVVKGNRVFGTAITADPGPEIMGIDCFSSIKSIVSAELANISFSVEPLLHNKQEVVFDSGIVINRSNSSSQSKIRLMKERSKSLNIHYDTSLSKWFKVSFNPQISGGFMNFIQLGFEFTKSKEWLQLATKGEVQIESQMEQMFWEQEVTEPPMTMTNISITMIPIRGTIPFQAVYRFRSAAFTTEQVLRALHRVGFEDEGILQQEDGNLIARYNGTLTVNSGFNTLVVITCSNLTSGDVVDQRTFPYYARQLINRL